MKPEGYFYQATLDMLESNPTLMAPRHFDFETYEKPTLKQLSKNLQAFRKTLGESQESFSKKIEISRPQFRKYESGEDVIRLDVAHRISIKFGLPVFFLVANSPYQALLNLPNTNSSFDKIWRYANTLDDVFFLKLCSVLETYIGSNNTIQASDLPNASNLNYDVALKENREAIYVAIAEGIKAVRQYFSCSQEDIAELMGISLSTYREYEKPTQRPRYNLLVSIRWTASTGIHPFYILAGTELLKVRNFQNKRIDALLKLFSQLSSKHLAELVPLVEGFYQSCSLKENALLLPARATSQKRAPCHS